MSTIPLPAAQRRAQPWKNGLGVSHTIAEFPQGAGFDAMEWQVGHTDIGADCPFSDLPGLDRQFMVIAGVGVELTSKDAETGAAWHERIERLQAPYAFRGDWSTQCRLLAGPVRVLNVITRRKRCAAAVDFADATELAGAAGETLIAVDLASLDAWRLDGAGSMRVPRGDVAVVRIRAT
jgi:environmental stress-induced protein Ves